MILILIELCYEPMNMTDKELSKLTSVFCECGKGSVQLMAKHHKCKDNNDKHRNKEDE